MAVKDAEKTTSGVSTELVDHNMSYSKKDIKIFIVLTVLHSLSKLLVSVFLVGHLLDTFAVLKEFTGVVETHHR
jgi:hypothetical protein